MEIDNGSADIINISDFLVENLDTNDFEIMNLTDTQRTIVNVLLCNPDMADVYLNNHDDTITLTYLKEAIDQMSESEPVSQEAGDIAA